MTRNITILLTIFLTAFAWQSARHDVTSPGLRIAAPSPPADEKPFYAEDFINQEVPGTISHVSTLSPLGPKTMACAWYSGSREGAGDVAIYFSVFNESKKAWSAPAVVMDRARCSDELHRYVKKVGNPLLMKDADKRLRLFYSSVFGGGWSGSSLNYVISENGGQTWTKSRKILLSPFFNLTNNVKNRGLLLDDGSFIVPVYHEFIRKFSQLLFVRPSQKGDRFTISKITTSGKAIQPVILQGDQRTLTAFFRNMDDRNRKYILRADSADFGRSWSALSETSLPNPNSGFDMIITGDGSYLGVINNSHVDRSNLSLVISHDKGHTWRVLRTLEDQRHKEYSYPSISQSRSGLYHITYTYERMKIKHIMFNAAWLALEDGHDK
jgi:predicted neuraminidase